ncbi:MAG: hypothetical protein K2Z81_16180, partial [Cyanobacteria bacterium]|nr:hypothetical protein [Cyanobacteriota bacterium]
INGVGGRSLHHHNLNLEHSDNQSNSSMEESAAIPDHSNSSLLNINEEVEEGSQYSSTHIPGGQPSTSIEEASDESMSIAMINLNAWVRAGAPNEQRQTAEKQIMAHLNRSQNIWCTLSGLKLSTLPNIFQHFAIDLIP